MLNKKIVTIPVLLLLLQVEIFAQKYSNEFLNIGFSARAQAMGNAQVGSVADATAGCWNPAGLAQVRDFPQLTAMHAEWFASIGKYDYFAAALPLRNSKQTLGISAIRFGIDNIPNTLSLYEEDGTINYENVVPFSAVDYAIFLSYAQILKNDKLSVGGSVKIIPRIIGSFANSWGFGLDAGLQFRPNEHWRFGIVGKDITTTFNAWSFNFSQDEKNILGINGNEIPINSVEVTKPQIVLGAGFEQNWEKVGLLAETNIAITTDGKRNVLLSSDPISVAPMLGLELHYKRLVYLRMGANELQKEVDLLNESFWTFHPNVGVGVRLGKLRADYAFTNVGESSNNTYSHVVSLLLDVDFQAKR